MKSRLFEADVISEKISDHRPLIHNGVLFWNVMMQGKVCQGGRFNNGFGLVESDERYMQRLGRVAETIIQLIEINREIEAIALCEGPIQTEHLDNFMAQLKCASVVHRFTNDAGEQFYKPNTQHSHNWGLLLMVDNKYKVEPVMLERLLKLAEFSKLANRIQMWRLVHGGHAKFVTLAHFPYAQDVRNTEIGQFTRSANVYRSLIDEMLNDYSNEDFVFCADFNFNPYLISDHKMRQLDLIPNNNSLLLTEQRVASVKTTLSVTVDGILLSNLNKQKLHWLEYAGLFAMEKKEWQLMHSLPQGKIPMLLCEKSQLTQSAYC